jgi:mannose-6-phosphate isomerase
MSVPPPFRCVPILKPKAWGGGRLAALFGGGRAAAEPIGESWEVSDVGDDVSVIADGPWAGRTLRDLASRDAAALYGGRRLPPARFPLLLKLLDATAPLSIQVHPDDATAAALGAPSGKTEAWVVLHADPGARVWRGVRPGTTRAEVEARLAAGTLAEVLHAIPAAPGDAVFVPPGTIHAIGAGVVLYEIQQAADVTYRLDDWGRVGTDGRPRALQVREALAAADLQQPCLDKRIPAALGPGQELLVACDKFTLRRWRGPVAEDGRRLGPHCLTVVAGGGRLAGDFGTVEATLGTTVVVPHAAGAYRWEPAGDAVALCAHAPACEAPTGGHA